MNRLTVKRIIIPLILGVYLYQFPAAVLAADLDTWKQEEADLQQELDAIESDIDQTDATITGLKDEQLTLEEKIDKLRDSIETLNTDITDQTQAIHDLEEAIADNEQAITHLTEDIAGRQDHLENQARALQTTIAPAELVDMLLSADSITELIGRVSVVNRLVKSNRQTLDTQAEHKQQLADRQVKLQVQHITMADTLDQLAVDRNNLLNQHDELYVTIEQLRHDYTAGVAYREKMLAQQEAITWRAEQLKQDIQAETEKQAEATALAQAAEAALHKQEQQQTVDTTSIVTSTWAWPAQGILTSPFGNRIHPISGVWDFHQGIDIAGSGDIVASKSGIVVEANYRGSYGYQVLIDHGDGYHTRYAHLQGNLYVAPGQSVQQNQTLGLMGSTGSSTGVHLHFEIIQNDTPVNPLGYLN